jgi:hypothetical protein
MPHRMFERILMSVSRTAQKSSRQRAQYHQKTNCGVQKYFRLREGATTSPSYRRLWGLQAHMMEGVEDDSPNIWMNTVGTFGVLTSSYPWAREARGISRTFGNL